MEAAETSINENDKKVPKKKKRPKEKQEKPDDDEPEKPSAKDLALSYLKLWKKHRSSWSFKKVRQVWLIKHLYDPESIKKKYFKYLLQYLEESKGGVRTRLIENAQSIFESSSSNTEGEEAPDPIKLERAKMVIQMLTE